MAVPLQPILDFPGYDAVPGHDILDDGVVRIVGRIGHQNAGAAPGSGRCLVNGVIVGAVHPNDLCSLRLNTPGTRVANASVQEDFGGCARKFGRGGDGETMVTVTGANESRQITRTPFKQGGNVQPGRTGEVRANPRRCRRGT